MIIFKSDWDLYPDAIVDSDTKNKSFIEMAAKYRKMGIDNAEFVLALHNPELKGIDPHDPDLDIATIANIVIECKENPWYYIREVVRIPTQGTSEPVSFRANRSTIMLYWLFFNHITPVVVQPRQTGKTITTGTLMRYLLNIACVNTHINQLTLSEALRQDTIENLKAIEEELPPYLQMTTKGDANNNYMITVSLLNNAYRSFLPQKSKKAAYNVMRGHTAPIFHIDEAANLYNIDITLPAALAAGTAVREIAEKHGSPYGTIITSNAGRKDDPSGKFVYDMLSSSMIWTEKLFDSKDRDELYDTVRKNGTGGKLMVNASFNHRQLGYTDAWLKKKIQEAVASGEDAERDFLNKWTSGQYQSPLSKEDISIIENSKKQDYVTTISDVGNYITRWYIPEYKIATCDSSGGIVIGLDTSDAIGKDEISMVIRDISTGGVISAGSYNETNLFIFSEWLTEWLVKYNKIMMVVERRSSGMTIMDTVATLLMANGINPFKKLFNWLVQDADTNPDEFKMVTSISGSNPRLPDIYNKHRKKFGYATSASGRASRENLYGSVLTQSVKYTGNMVYDVPLAQQILSLVTKKGRIDHPDGEHDDMVIAWLLSYWGMTQGKNLNTYGLDTSTIMRNRPLKKDETPEDRYKDKRAQSLRKEIADTIKKIQDTRDIYKIETLERKLNNLMFELRDLGYIETYSIEEIQAKIKAEKKKKRRLW